MHGGEPGSCCVLRTLCAAPRHRQLQHVMTAEPARQGSQPWRRQYVQHTQASCHQPHSVDCCTRLPLCCSLQCEMEGCASCYLTESGVEYCTACAAGKGYAAADEGSVQLAQGLRSVLCVLRGDPLAPAPAPDPAPAGSPTPVAVPSPSL